MCGTCPEHVIGLGSGLEPLLVPPEFAWSVWREKDNPLYSSLLPVTVWLMLTLPEGLREEQ